MMEETLMYKPQIILFIIVFLSLKSLANGMRTKDQFYTYKFIYDIFKTGNVDNDEKLNKILVQNITKYPHYFGTSCNLSAARLVVSEDSGAATTHLHYRVVNSDLKYVCAEEDDIDVKFQTNFNILRAGLIVKACTEIFFPEFDDSKTSLENTIKENYIGPYVRSIISKVCPLYDKCFFSNDVIASAVKQFYPIVGNLSDSFFDEVRSIHGIESDDSSKDVVKLKHFFYALCIDPNWQ